MPDHVASTPDTPGLAAWRRAVTAGFAVGGVAVTAWGPRLPALTSTFGLDPGTVGLLLAGVTVGALLGLVVANPLFHRTGGRRGVGVAAATVAVGLGGLGAADAAGSLLLLAVAFVVTGAGIGTLDVLVNVEGSANEQVSGRTLLPRMHAAWSIGAAAGAGIGAACAAAGVAPSAQFVGEGVLVVTVMAAVVRSIPGRPDPGRPGHDPGDVPAHGPGSGGRWGSVRRWLAAWADGRLLLIGLVMLGCEVGEGSANTWLTLGAHDGHGLSPTVAALFFAAFAASEALARIFGGPAVDRVGRVATVRATAALGGVGLALFIAGRGPWLPLAGVVLWAVGVSMGFPLGMSAAAEGGGDPALRVSVVATVGYAANLAAPPVVGAVARSTGVLGSLWIVVGGLALAGLSAVALRPGPARRPARGRGPGRSAGGGERTGGLGGGVEHPPPGVGGRVLLGEGQERPAPGIGP